MSGAASESDEREFGAATKNLGMVNILMHHVLADLSVILEREFWREAITKIVGAEEQSQRHRGATCGS